MNAVLVRNDVPPSDGYVQNLPRCHREKTYL
jgi:hypothetical protein